MDVGRYNTPDIYDKAYLLSPYLEGYEEFTKGRLSVVKAKQLKMLALKKGITLLEVGFGRGELLYHCAKKGSKVTGIDFSPEALEIARHTLREFANIDIRLARCTDLPFDDNSFHRVFAGDVIEHVPYEQAIIMLRELYRVLKPGGFMLIHTTPNTVFIKLIYPFARYLLNIIDKHAVQLIDEHRANSKRVHIHEYNLFSLKTIGRRAGLEDFEVWIDEDILRSRVHRHTRQFGKNLLIKFIGSCGKYLLVRFLLGNDLYLKCYK